MTYYYLHLDYKDRYIAKFKTNSTDMNLIYKKMSENIIKDGFNHGFTIQQQIKRYTTFCDSIYKMKDHCEKIRASDFILFFSCYCALCKFNCIKPNEYMFLKIKKRK